MESQFKAEDYDGGVTSAVSGILNVYRSHLSTNSRQSNNQIAVPRSSALVRNGGFHISMFWWIVIIVVGFLIVRSIVRAASAPRHGPGGMPPGAIPPGGMPPGGYGYGGGLWRRLRRRRRKLLERVAGWSRRSLARQRDVRQPRRRQRSGRIGCRCGSRWRRRQLGQWRRRRR